MALDNSVRQQIVIAALTATGEQQSDESGEAWAARASMNAAKFAAILGNERHPILRAIDQIANSKVFTAEVVSITKEQSSTRGVVTLQTGSTRTDDGTETVRTDRTDGQVGLAMAKRVRSLVGHRVVVWIEVEPIGDGTKKSRVLRHIEDLGMPRERD